MMIDAVVIEPLEFEGSGLKLGLSAGGGDRGEDGGGGDEARAIGRYCFTIFPVSSWTRIDSVSASAPLVLWV